MVDGHLQVGDVAIDLVKRGNVQVVAKAADSVTEFTNQEGLNLAAYKSHPLLDIDPGEPVYSCVYLSSEPTTSYNGTYDFPASRLARQPVEEANDQLDRVQDTIVRDVLEGLFRVAGRHDMASNPDELFDIASHTGIDEDLVEEARELAVVDDHFDDEESEDGELGDFDGGGA